MEKEVEKKVVVKKKKVSRSVPVARAHVKSTFNNTFIAMTDLQGNVIAWSSSGVMGFSGAKKSTAYAAQVVATDCAKKASDYGVREIEVYVKGPGAGRESAIRALQAAGITITAIKDVTPVPHNGCRPPKRRRV